MMTQRRRRRPALHTHAGSFAFPATMMCLLSTKAEDVPGETTVLKLRLLQNLAATVCLATTILLAVFTRVSTQFDVRRRTRTVTMLALVPSTTSATTSLMLSDNHNFFPAQMRAVRFIEFPDGRSGVLLHEKSAMSAGGSLVKSTAGFKYPVHQDRYDCI